MQLGWTGNLLRPRCLASLGHINVFVGPEPVLTAEKGHREHALSERRLGLALRKRLVTQSFSHRCPSLTVQTRASVRHARDGRTEGWPATYCRRSRSKKSAKPRAAARGKADTAVGCAHVWLVPNTKRHLLTRCDSGRLRTGRVLVRPTYCLPQLHCPETRSCCVPEGYRRWAESGDKPGSVSVRSTHPF